MKLIPFLKSNGKYQIFDRSNRKFINSKEYDKINLSQDKSYTVMLNNKYGILDFDGNELIKCSYDLASGFDQNGLALIIVNEKYGFIDKSNMVVIPTIYDNASDFCNGFACVRINGEYKFINIYGEFLNNIGYDETSIFWDGICPVKVNGKWGLIKNDGKMLIKPQYDSLSVENGVVRVEKDYQYFLIDLNNIQISADYDYMDYESDGVYMVCKNKMYGHIKNNGETLIPLMYENCSNFNDGYAGAFANGNWFFINKQNQLIIEPGKFNIIEIAGDVKEGIAVIMNENYEWGFIDINCKDMVIDFKYEDTRTFSSGLCAFKFENKWGIFDKKGNLKVDFKYSDVGYFNDGVALVTLTGRLFKGNSDFYIDTEGNEFCEQ